MTPLRIAFMGTPDFAVPALAAIAAAGHTVPAVYTQPPRPAGRGKKPRPSPVALEAERLGVTRRSLADAADVAQHENPAVARLLGAGGHLDALGLPEGWSRRAIAAVGNYKEVYDRHLGALSPLRLERGPNALQEEGGLLLLPSMQ